MSKYYHVAQPEDCDCLAAIIVDDELLSRAELGKWVAREIAGGMHVTRLTPEEYAARFPTWGCPTHPRNRYSERSAPAEQPGLFDIAS